MNDIVNYLCTFLTDRDKLSFLSVSSHYDSFKSKIFFNGQYPMKKINHLKYFDQFTNIIIGRLSTRIGDIMTDENSYLFLEYFDQFTSIIIDRLKTHAKTTPTKNNHTYLLLKYFDKINKYHIPSNVTHVTFGNDFNYDIILVQCIPSCVTHLTFG